MLVGNVFVQAFGVSRGNRTNLIRLALQVQETGRQPDVSESSGTVGGPCSRLADGVRHQPPSVFWVSTLRRGMVTWTVWI